MGRIFKILVRTFLLFCALAGFAIFLTYYLASRSLPDYDRDFVVQGTTGRVEVVRANYAVPHIFSETETDVFFGLGFVHAQDRMWQMLMLRRTVQGRLSEIFGEKTLEIDKLMRTLDLYQVAVDGVRMQTPETRTSLQSYSDGVNAFLTAVGQEALGRGAPELFFFEPEIAPWTPADSIAVIKLLALQLNDKAATEVLQARLSLILPPERLYDLFPDEQGRGLMALPDYASVFPDQTDDLPQPRDYERHALYPLPPIGFAGASNAWAVAEQRSASGGALLASDPHLTLSAPSVWMLARLQFENGGVIGATIPGIPAILSGRNGSFSWGLTASYLDDQDVFVEKLNPDNAEEYLTPTGYETFETRDEIINIKDKPGITETFRRSRHGPIIDGTHWDLASVLPPGHVAALAWPALDADDQTIEAVLKMMKVRSLDEAPDVIAMVKSFSTNVIMADRRDVGMIASGHAPKRKLAHTSKGRIPAPGWLAQNDWDGYLPALENPRVLRPESGVIANTNNRTTDQKFPYHWSYDWGDDQRILRAERLLNGREFHTLDSFIEIQTDVISPTARTLIPLIARDLWYSGEPAATGTLEQRRQLALELLANWNGEMSEHNPEPLIYASWVRNLQSRLIVDEVGRLSSRLKNLRPLFIERVYRDINGAAIWCDVIQTSRKEDCTEIARAALDEALLHLVETYGPSIESWRWGNIHQALHKHEVLGNIPLLSWFVNIRQDTPGGDNTLLRGQTIGYGAEPFLNIHASGYRGVYDMADPEASLFVIATGQSGHFLSRHYDDLSQIWRRSEYVPMTLDPVLARGGNRGITVLLPADQN